MWGSSCLHTARQLCHCIAFFACRPQKEHGARLLELQTTYKLALSVCGRSVPNFDGSSAGISFSTDVECGHLGKDYGGIMWHILHCSTEPCDPQGLRLQLPVCTVLCSSFLSSSEAFFPGYSANEINERIVCAQGKTQ